MKKKGFTLIEMIVVIILLSLISLVVFKVVTTSIKTSKQTISSAQTEIVLKAAKVYYLDHLENLPDPIEGAYTILNLDNLIEEGYILENEIIDPKNNHLLKGKIKVSYLSNQYIYEFIPYN